MRFRRIDYEGEAVLLSQLRDLTELRRHETALREAEAEYRSLVENALGGVAISQDRRFAYVNAKFAEIVGYTQDELLELPSCLDLVFDDDRAMVEEKLRQRAEGEIDVAQYTARVRRKDGRFIVVEVNGAVMQYRGRSVIIGTLLDITERHRTDDQLCASEKHFRTLFEEVPVGIMMASTDTRIQRVNAAFCQMLGYTDTELIGRSIVDIPHPDDPAGTPESATRVFENAQRGTRVNKRYIRKDGAIVLAETTVALIRDDERDSTLAVAMVENVTEQRGLERQLEHVLRLESVEQLAAGVAHNFNNALTTISGYSELMALRFNEDDPARRDLAQIQRVTEESAQLTRQLLAFSREEHLQPTRFSLNDAVQST